MAQQRGRFALLFKPEGIEKDVPASLRLRFTMLGANRLHAVTPENQPELYGLLQNVSERTGMATPNAYIWESRKPVANAVAIPSGTPTIAFSKSITELLSPEELTAVAAHELGHVKNMAQSGTLFWLSAIGGATLAHFTAKPFKARMEAKRLAGVPLTPVAVTASLALEAGQWIAPMAAGAVASRAEEFAADRNAAAAMQGDAVPLLSALEKLGEFNGGNKHGHANPLRRLLSTHPTYEQRRQALGVSGEAVTAYRAERESLAPLAEEATRSFVDAVGRAPIAQDAPRAVPRQGEWADRVAASAETQETVQSR